MDVPGRFYLPAMTDILVAGEPVETLLEAFRQIEWETQPNGMTSLKASLERRLGDPFVRALMRVEAELLLQDAAALDGPEAGWRTGEQLAADAFVALTLRLSDALKSPT
jgi:hypothetical protein